jgi:hypothetical protein
MKTMNGKVLQWEASVPGEPPRCSRSVNKACDRFLEKRGMTAGPGSKGWLYGRRARRAGVNPPPGNTAGREEAA